MRILVQYINVLLAKTTSYDLAEEQFEIGVSIVDSLGAVILRLLQIR